MKENSFETAFTAAGGWFFLTQYEVIRGWSRDKHELIDLLFNAGFDSDKQVTETRVNAVLRIIKNNNGKNALEKIRNSTKINREHPDAKQLAEFLLIKYY